MIRLTGPTVLAALLAPHAAALQSLAPAGNSISKALAEPIEILEPEAGSLLNDATPSVLVEFPSFGVAPASVFVLLDGLPVEDQLTVLPQGVFGDLDPIPDGMHELEVLVAGAGPLVAQKKVVFETSTGGGPTRVFGHLLDPLDDAPIVGAQVYFEEGGPVAITDGAGYYEITGAPIGAGLHVLFDPVGLDFSDPVTLESWVYPKYKRVVDVYQGAKNQLAVCYLPRIEKLAELATLPEFDCLTSTFVADYTLSNPELEVELTIPAGTYCEFPSGDPCGEYLSIANVPVDKAPSELPEEFTPPVLVTVQPTGMKFRTGPRGDLVPLPITFPNDVGIPPGNEMALLSVDHELGAFVPMGTMLATAQGTFETIEGGLIGGSWHSILPPTPESGGAGQPPDQCRVPMNPDVRLSSGTAVEVFPLPKRRLFDEPYGPDLVYSSRALTGWEVVAGNMTYPVEGTPPRVWLVDGFIGGGLPSSRTLSWNGSNIFEDEDTPLRMVYPVRTKGVPPGLYDFQLTHTLKWLLTDCPWPPWYPGIAGDGNFCISTDLVFDQPMRIAVPAPAEVGLGRGWRLSGDNLLIADEGWVSIHSPDGDVESLVDSALGIGSGLRMQLFAGSSDTEVTSFFSTSSPVSFLANDGSTSVTVDVANVPNANFWNAGGPFLLHAGLDGQQQTTDLSAPAGDDVVYEVLSGADAFGVLLKGRLELDDAEVATFTASFDDACAVQIDGETVLSLTGTNPAGFASSAPIALEAGAHEVRIALADKGGLSHLQLFWSTAGGAAEIVPSSLLVPSDPDQPSGVFYRGVDGDFTSVTKLEDGTWRRDLGDKGYETYDAAGHVTSRVSRHGRTTTYVRDPDGRLLSIADPVGGTYDLLYSGSQLVEITDPANRTTAFQYAGEDLVTITDAAGHPWQFAYDERGLLTSSTDAEGHTTLHEYDDFGRYRRVEYPDGADRTIDYGDDAFESAYFQICLYGFLPGGGCKYSNPPVYFAFDPPEGRPVTVTNEVGAQTVHRQGRLPAPDALGGPTAGTLEVHSVVDPLGRTTQTTSDARSLPVLEEWRDAAGVPLRRIRREWDDRGLLTAVVDEGDLTDPTDDYRKEYGWDPTGSWLTSLTQAVGTPLERTATWVNDPATGEATSELDFAGREWKYEYGPFGTLVKQTDPESRVTDVLREPLLHNQTRTITGPESSPLYTFDTAGDVVAALTADGTAPWTFQRDVFGSHTAVTSPEGDTRLFEYDKTQRLVRVEDTKASPGVDLLEYDSRGRLTSHRDALARTTLFEYSPDGRLVKQTSPNGDELVFGYDDAARPTSLTTPDGLYTSAYDDLNRRTQLESPGSRIVYAYSPSGELISEAEFLGSPAYATTYEYDVLGRQSAIDLVLEGLVVKRTTFTPDLGDRLVGTSQSITDPTLPPLDLTYAIEYDEGNLRTAVDGPEGIRVDYVYDSARNLVSQATEIAGAPVFSDSLLRQGNGYPTSVTEARSLLPDSTNTLAYDGSERLTSAIQTDPAVPGEVFAPFDEVGNSETSTRVYDAADQLLSDGTYTYQYDANGNRSRRTTVATGDAVEYEYDALNRLVEVRELPTGGVTTVVATYAYDARGRRVEKNGVRFLYQNSRVEAAVDALGDRTYVTHLEVARDEGVAVYSSSGLSHLLRDGRGNVAQVVRGGAIVGERRYSAYGAIENEAGWSGLGPVDLGFMGREWDEETALWYAGRRHLDPGTGRFLQREPLYLGALASPTPFHAYEYAAWSPYFLWDRSGRNYEQMSPSACRAHNAENAVAKNLLCKGGGTVITLIGIALTGIAAEATIAVGGALTGLGFGVICDAFFDSEQWECDPPCSSPVYDSPGEMLSCELIDQFGSDEREERLRRERELRQELQSWCSGANK